MGRFLLYLSYLGTNYSGIQIQNVGHIQRPHIKTVVGVLQDCLTYLKPREDVKIRTSSRTDQGVHAFINTVHVDLTRQYGGEFNADYITYVLNGLLSKKKEDIRVLKTLRVNDDFHCRYNAVSRSYVYRLSVSKPSQQYNDTPVYSSIFEKDRLYRVRQPFDVGKFIKAAEVLSGRNNFSAMTVEKGRLFQNHLVRSMDINIKRGDPLYSHQQFVEDYDVWEIHFKSRSYLYKQIRRMVGCMVQVAKDVLPIEDLKKLLQNPKHIESLQSHQIATAGSRGLYLKEVFYNPSDLVYQPTREVDYQLFQDEAYENYFLEEESTDAASNPEEIVTPLIIENNSIENEMSGLELGETDGDLYSETQESMDNDGIDDSNSEIDNENVCSSEEKITTSDVR